MLPGCPSPTDSDVNKKTVSSTSEFSINPFDIIIQIRRARVFNSQPYDLPADMQNERRGIPAWFTGIYSLKVGQTS